VQYHYVDLQRLKLRYLIKKAYKRTVTTTGMKVTLGREERVPRYLYRKLAEYVFFAVTALSTDRRRFFLVRTAAALGEMKGYRKNRDTASTLNDEQH
jgi:hypothetical protein